MNPTEKHVFGQSRVDVTVFAFGTAPLGNFLHEVGEDATQAMINRVWDRGVSDCLIRPPAHVRPRVGRTPARARSALEKLRSEGVVKGIGVGVNEWQVCYEALQQCDFDCFLLAGRQTLLEQDVLRSFLPLCEERGVTLLVGEGFNSGIFATGAVPGAKYNYMPAPAEILERVSRIEGVCREYDVPQASAALQFVVAHPAIRAFCADTRTVEQLEQNLDCFSFPIPADFWDTLKQRGLLAENAPVPSELKARELEAN